MHVCLTVVSRTGFGRYLSALRIEVIMLTDKIGRGGVGTQQTRNVIVTFSIGFKLVTLNLTFGKR